MAKIIVIEGMDGTGKETQSKMLFKAMTNSLSKRNIYRLSFPNYGETSSVLVDMYLHGRIREDPMDVNPYAAASTYALDRYISYERNWKKLLEDDNTIIIMDRYVTSNVIHQANKLDKDKQEAFADWVYDYEYNKLGLPRPDVEIYLYVNRDANRDLLKNRKMLDLHESTSYQDSCRTCFENLKETSLRDMMILNCNDENGNIYPIEDIHNRIVRFLNTTVLCV